MRLIPATPSERATGSERRVFSLLAEADLGPSAIALSALNLAEHDYKRWGEIDFLLVMPDGLVALEVKGGQVSCVDGIWRFEDRLGRRVERREAPIVQAQSAYSALLKFYLVPTLGEPRIRRLPTGFSVIFPFSRREQAAHLAGGPEMPEELVGFAEDASDPGSVEAFVQRVLGYWRQRLRGTCKALEAQEVKAIAQALRPSIDRIEPLSLSLTRVREEMLELTEAQYRVLDYLETAPRVLCSGGAGTGKTLLAVECLRRERNAVLVTGTHTLAGHLRAENLRRAGRIYSFDEIASRQRELHGQFDVLIVDEGQQITNVEAIGILAGLLGKPLGEGRWRWFGDANRQLSATSRFDPAAQAFLESQASVRPTLDVNCRNTPQIAQAVEFITGGTLGKERTKGAGPVVEYASSEETSGCAREAAEAIQRWTRDGEVKPGQVICLSTLPLEKSTIPLVARLAGLEVLQWQPGWESRREYPRFLGAATIEEFRGLEAPFTVLCDPGEDLPAFASNLYLAMTRANFGLFVASRRNAREALALSRLASKGQSPEGIERGRPR